MQVTARWDTRVYKRSLEEKASDGVWSHNREMQGERHDVQQVLTLSPFQAVVLRPPPETHRFDWVAFRSDPWSGVLSYQSTKVRAARIRIVEGSVVAESSSL